MTTILSTSLEDGLKLSAGSVGKVPWTNAITYHFATVLPAYYAGVSTGYQNGATGTLQNYDGNFAVLNAAEQATTLGIFGKLSEFLGATFTAKADATADLVMGALTFDSWTTGASPRDVPGFAYLANEGTAKAGDFWLSNAYRFNATITAASKDHGIFVIAHELGHSLGLPHPVDAGLSEAVVTQRLSIMSYQIDADGEGRFRHEFQLYDIAALQRLYGKGSANAGQTTYSVFNETSPAGVDRDRSFSIWDSGGDGDKIDASGYVKSAFIDLRPGHFSSIGPNANVALTGNALTDAGKQNMSIAFGSYIEDATGSAERDLIVGNIFANKIDGGAGNDVLFASGKAVEIANTVYGTQLVSDATDGDYRSVDTSGIVAFTPPDPKSIVDTLDGGTGDDLLVGDDGDDILNGGDGRDTAVYKGNFDTFEILFNTDGTVNIGDPTGKDTLKDVEFAKFGDKEIDLRPGQDIAFVIDTTGSMFDDIDAVKAQSAAIIDAIFDADRGFLNSHVAVVGYNDPFTETFLSFTEQPDPKDRKDAAIAAINSISVGGGGDFPESVNAGLIRALDGSAGAWRADAVSRKIILFGDAPPNDPELAGQVRTLAAGLDVTVPSPVSSVALSKGLYLTTFSVASAADGVPVPIQIFTVVIGGDESTVDAFGSIATDTGGTSFSASDATDVVEVLLDVLRTPVYRIEADPSSITEGNSGTGTVNVTVSRDVGEGAATVTLERFGTSDADDATNPPPTVVFAEGETTKTIAVSVTGDTAVEADETYGVRIVSVDKAASIATGSVEFAIVNDDVPVYRITADKTVVTEGNSGTTDVTITVSRDAGVGEATVTLERFGASTADDAGNPPPTIVFADGETTTTITVSVVGDTTIEADEAYGVRIAGIDKPATIATGSVEFSIVNDDVPIYRVAVDKASIAEGNAGTTEVTFTITRDAGLDAAIVTLERTGTSDAADASGLPASVNFASGEVTKTIAVTVHGDTDFEQDETYGLKITGIDKPGTIATATSEFSITNDDVRKNVATRGSDDLVGTSANDKIGALAGNDSVYGLAGDDTLLGNAGNDRLHGEDGDDTLQGGDGHDHLSGGNGNDRIGGGAGSDSAVGGAGNDVIFGGEGDDVIHGGAGKDVLRGGAGNDTIYDMTGDDIIEGGTGNDRIVLSFGRDVLQFRSDYGNDRVIGFRIGSDVLDFSHHEGVSEFEDLHIFQRADSAIIEDVDGFEIVLAGIQASRLSESDFLI